MPTVVEVAPDSELLAQVRGLWRTNSDTLGFFPDGAFDEHARDRCILAAIDDDGSFLGYTLFRTTHRRQAAIVHLCIDNAARKKGVARYLFEALKVRVSGCNDVILRCRRDFEASQLWPRLGFVAVKENVGRGKDAKVVTTWRYELSQLPLLAAIDRRSSNNVIQLVIDANIFFDLDEEAPGREESNALQADWIGEFIELCLTEEIYNEINRREDPSQRKRQRERAERFRILSSDKQREAQVVTELQSQYPGWISASAQSDMRQLARTIASGVNYFITRDTLVRDQADVLYERYGLVVVSPFELVLRFDELRREDEYRPRRFISSGLRTVKPRGPDDLEQIADLIHVGQPAPQPRGRTLARLRDIVAAPERFELTCIRGNDEALIAAYAVERPTPNVLLVPLFAVAGSELGRTAARHFAEKIASLAALERRTLVKVMEEAGGTRIEEALLDAGFSKEGALWIKIALSIVAPVAEILDELGKIVGRHPEAISLATRVAEYLRAAAGASAVEPAVWARVERSIWPAKIVGAGLPCFIIPIQARWAKDLFDLELADRTLFGADPQLMMNSENAYYRASRPLLTVPARVLWYVSKNSSYPGSMAIRACSYIDEVLVARPKDAFRRFRRLGVYSWRDVFKVAENDLEKEIMAFRFSKTELFRQPVPWKQLQDVLLKYGGKNSQLQSPTSVSESCFLEFYHLGMLKA